MKLTIIGTGYVGLVTGTCFAEMGNKVYCVDNDLEKIANLKNNILPIYEPNLASLVKSNQKKGDLIFTTDLKEALDNSNIIFIAVGTPEHEDGSVNLDYVYDVASEIADVISQDSLIVIKSTVLCISVAAYFRCPDYSVQCATGGKIWSRRRQNHYRQLPVGNVLRLCTNVRGCRCSVQTFREQNGIKRLCKPRQQCFSNFADDRTAFDPCR